MNQLSVEKRAQIFACLAEGNSLRATARLTGACFNSVLKFLPQLGRACSIYQDKVFRNLTCKRIQCDEIWSFVGCKERNVRIEEKGKGRGDCWVWICLDAETKLMPCWYVGPRDSISAYHFMHDMAARLNHRVQLTTDGFRPYLEAVTDSFGDRIDYAMLQKIYGEPPKTEARYSPAQCMGAKKALITGQPDYAHISTSHVERQNLTLRMSSRRFTRLTNAFSKKVENHEHAVAVYMMHYNFCRIHQTLRVTPAMQAGITNHVWSLDEVINLLSSDAAKAA